MEYESARQFPPFGQHFCFHYWVQPRYAVSPDRALPYCAICGVIHEGERVLRNRMKESVAEYYENSDAAT